ncbi:helix-turn-helix domain-containing protein [Modestobacter excelsi]|uniref:helix-turn-helix domain-containing protein n=1 Tax=Modestobacter excelsi TaxID=2213161 RepID=UPI00110D15AD|nr:LysR family transcriptional regulator [Modestobacter excelsi]
MTSDQRGPNEPIDSKDVLAVVDFFDGLLDDEVDAAGLVRQVASFAGCSVGIRTATGAVISTGPSGVRGASQVPAGAVRSPLRRGGEVWLDRAGGPEPRDALLLRRLVVVAGLVLAAGADAQDRDSLLATVLSDRTGEVDRIPALRRLRLTGNSTLRAFAVSGSPAAVGAVVDQIRNVSPTVHATALSQVTAVLAEEPAVPGQWNIPVGVRMAYSVPWPAAQAPQAWQQARTGFRFALPSTHASGPYTDNEAVGVPGERVGGFAILAEGLRAEDIARVPDVQALDRIVLESGEEAIRVLEAVAATESLRRAASLVHLHHNSVAARLQAAERALGFSTSQPYGRFRLLLALALRRVRDSPPIE